MISTIPKRTDNEPTLFRKWAQLTADLARLFFQWAGNDPDEAPVADVDAFDGIVSSLRKVVTNLGVMKDALPDIIEAGGGGGGGGGGAATPVIPVVTIATAGNPTFEYHVPADGPYPCAVIVHNVSGEVKNVFLYHDGQGAYGGLYGLADNHAILGILNNAGKVIFIEISTSLDSGG